MTVWASSTGSTIIGSLVATAAEWSENYTTGGVEYGKIVYQFNAANLSGVLPGHYLTVSGFGNALNNGTFYVVAVDDTANTITIRNTSRTDATADQTGQTGAGTVTDAGALKQEPSAAKFLQGFIPGEKVAAQTLNYILNKISLLGGFFTLADWKSEPHSGEELNLIKGQGFYRFDGTATDEPGEGFISQNVGAGIGIIESPHPDAMAAMLAAFVPEILPPVQAVLNFDSVSAGAVGTPLTVTVPGAVVGDQVILGPPSGIDTGLMWAGFVSAADTVQIRLFNGTGSPINPAEATWAVTVMRPNSMPVITTRGLKIFVNLIGGVYDSTSLEADLGIADNEAAFNLLVNSRQHRAALLDGGTIEAIISGSATADAIILATGGY